MNGPGTDPRAVPEGCTRVRLDLAYDGTGFSGWARQPGRETVQQRVEDALSEICGRPIAVQCAGRTDAGVHAVANFISFKLKITSSYLKLPEKMALKLKNGEIKIKKSLMAEYIDF